MPIYTANSSNVLLDGEPIEGLQSITYKVSRNRQDVAAVGTDERIDVLFGLKIVSGKIEVKSTNPILDGHLEANTAFQIVANLKKELGLTAAERTVTFDECFLDDKDFGIDTNGVAVTTYLFTATRVREE